MAASSNISEIFAQVEKLDGDGQLALLEKLAMLLRKKGVAVQK